MASLLAAKKLESNSSRELLKSYSAHSALIVLAKNEDFNRALWEVGYQFLNVMLQANSLNLAYRAILLDSTQRRGLVDLGVNDPIAVLAV